MLDFPSQPQVGDTFSGPSGQQWMWTGNVWSARRAWVPLPHASVVLQADAGLTVGVNSDVLSLDVGTKGIWFVAAGATVVPTGTAGGAQLWIGDGTTTIASGTISLAMNYYGHLNLSGIITNPVSTILLRATNLLAGASFYVKANFTNYGTDTYMSAIRIG